MRVTPGRLTAIITVVLWIASGLTTAAWAERNVTVPQVGSMIDTGGALRTVSGIAGSFVAGPVRAPRTLALACADNFCIAKTEGSLITPHGILSVPTGAAVLATDGKRSMVWFAQSGAFVELWIGGRTPRLRSQAWKVDGRVLSMRITPDGADIAVRRDSGVWIVTPDGTAIDTLPAEASGAVLLLDAGAAYVSGTDVVVRNGDGSEVRFALPSAPQAIFRMGADWVEIITAAANYALRINPGLGTPAAISFGRPSIFMLPGASSGLEEPRPRGL
jgi:hypothetical protein